MTCCLRPGPTGSKRDVDLAQLTVYKTARDLAIQRADMANYSAFRHCEAKPSLPPAKLVRPLPIYTQSPFVQLSLQK